MGLLSAPKVVPAATEPYWFVSVGTVLLGFYYYPYFSDFFV